MLLSPLFYRYYCTWELYVFPCSKQVTYVQVAILTGKCSGPMGLAVGLHFVCSPQGGSQHRPLSESEKITMDHPLREERSGRIMT